MTDKLPDGYKPLPLPSWDNADAEKTNSWYGVVHSRARILDPQFYGGKTEAIRMIVGRETHKDYTWIKQPIPGPWIEFRNFKEANAFVQVWKRMNT